MGFLSKLFGNNDQKQSFQSVDQHENESKVQGYVPSSVDHAAVMEKLDKIAEDALHAFYKEKNADMATLGTTEEERYSEYRQLSDEKLAVMAEEGDASAQYAFACVLADMADTTEDPEVLAAAGEWLKKSADAGNPDAQYAYGVFLMRGWTGEKDEKLAMDYLRKAEKSGLWYEAAVEMSEWLSEQVNAEHGYEAIKENVHCLANLVYGAKGTEDEWLYSWRASAVCQLNTLVDLAVLWNMDIEHIKDEQITGYASMERVALMGYYFERKVVKSGKFSKEDWSDMGDILCMIGEIALELERDYAVDVLRVAADMGKDYAAVLVARPMIEDAVRNGISKEEREVSPFFRQYKERTEKVTEDSSDERHQAHALVALSAFYDYGAGVAKNTTMAYRYMEKAANMKYGFAQHMLQIFERMPNGEYRRKRY